MDRHTQKDSERSHSGQNTQARDLLLADAVPQGQERAVDPAPEKCPPRAAALAGAGGVTGSGRQLWTVSSTRGSRAGSGAWPGWNVYHPKGPCLSCPARRPSPR